ncbi:MAG: endonuclease III [Acutalibacteraceae bacterium]|nr:endonuclease III [Acutalibacteraceae bacterium]
MTLKEKKEKIEKIVDLMEKEYPDATCSLNAKDPFQLLVATRLSAQCTDARVNIITPALFAALPTPEAFANATAEEVEELIKSCGLYRSKAKDLVALGKVLTEKFDSTVPDTMEELTSLPGIGRKTANLILGDVYGKPAVVTDTHFIRLCNRMGFVKTKEPKKVEDAMRKILPPERSSDFCHRSVLHGRAVCTARNPKCEICCIKDICDKKI